MNKQLIKYFIISLLCLPVFFINIKSSHDWGDDFAQYIHQAKNITQGIPQTQTGYIYNPQFPILGPPSYPVGFPILLAPLYAMFGNNIHCFDLYMSFFVFVLALLMFYFLHKYYSALISTLLVVVFIYNPWTLNFKMEIMSDFPFTVLLLLATCIYTSTKPITYIKSIFLAVLIGFLISVRNIGLVFIFAVALDCIHKIYLSRSEIRKKTYDYKNVLPLIIIAFGGFLSYILLNKIIFKTAGDGIFSYNYLLNTEQLKHFILVNLHYYMAVLRSYFEPWNDDWQFVALFSGTMIFAFIVLGMIKKMSERFGFIDIVALLYLFVIIIYPYSNAGFRFLLPLVPHLLYYAVQGLLCVNIKLKVNTSAFALVITAFVLFSYQKGLREIFKWENTTLHGPQESESIEAFSYINHNIPTKARFDFIKPRALALYTNCNAMSNKPKQTTTEMDQALNNNNIQYLLVNTDISDDSSKSYLKLHEKDLTKMWSNAKFSLYKRN